jgi:Spy/CpxP family protein refolding chaperone
VPADAGCGRAIVEANRKRLLLLEGVMKGFLGLALVVIVAAAPLDADAQTPRAPGGQEAAVRGPGQPAGVGRLLERHRAELDLTADQVAQLQAIRSGLQQRNAPLVEQLRASGAWQERADAARRGERARPGARARGGAEARRGEQARGARRLPEELRPVAQQLRQNNRAAMQEARAVLTDEQTTRLRELAQQRRAEARANRGARGPR